MKITDLLALESIELQGNAGTKAEVLNKVVDLMIKSGKITDREAYSRKVFDREEEGTTGIGGGIAIPHGKCQAVKEAGLAAMVIPAGAPFDSLDGAPVELVFLIAAPDTEDNVHLAVLSKLSVLLMNPDFIGALKAAPTKEAFLGVIEKAERERDAAEAMKEAAQAKAERETSGISSTAGVSGAAGVTGAAGGSATGGVSSAAGVTGAAGGSGEGSRGKRILAVTACPTGIAHTYMAAESIERRAKEMGCFVKVETRGSGGAKNVLTAAEIAEADCIIVAADTKVPMDRFHGKNVIQCPVSDGISKAVLLVDRAIKGDAPVFLSGEGGMSAQANSQGESMGHKVYKQLMNGVSHMLPFVVGGGILIAIAFLIDGFSVDINSLSAEMKSQFGTLTPLAAFFKNLGGMAFGFMLPILAGFIAESIADRPGLAVGFVGGAIAANGTSGFLGALLAGFIAGYVILLLRKVFEILPKSMDGLKPVLLYPLLGILITGLIMVFAVEPPIGALNTMLNQALTAMNDTSAILLGIVLGGMMAIDMGGPFNKAAYVFGTASIASGNYHVMAAVMIGGMVPPCAIALATLLFKKKFTEEERKSGPTNFIMGLSFITEGAIPFAASDPLRVIPACIVGSALAGALSMAFRCTLMAPHGGIFVFPVVGNALFYLVALVAGTVAGAFILGLLKKEVK